MSLYWASCIFKLMSLSFSKIDSACNFCLHSESSKDTVIFFPFFKISTCYTTPMCNPFQTFLLNSCFHGMASIPFSILSSTSKAASAWDLIPSCCETSFNSPEIKSCSFLHSTYLQYIYACKLSRCLYSRVAMTCLSSPVIQCPTYGSLLWHHKV